MEEWKNLSRGDMDYFISNKGNIRSKRGFIKKRLNKDGYEMVTLGKKDKRSIYRIHRLVAESFIENPYNLEEVNHIDFDRKNNCVKNLEWCSHLDNVRHTVNNNRHVTCLYDFKGENNPNYGNNKLKEKYKNNPELKVKCSRPGSLNGRSKPVALYKDGVFIKRFGYTGECCEFLIVNGYTKLTNSYVRGKIMKAIKNNETYLDFTFKSE